MYRKLFLGLAAAVFAVAYTALVYATPSTTYWTPCTSDIQAFNVWHITYDNYVSAKSSFPADYGLTVGALPFEKFQVEAGFDVLAPVTGKFLDNAVYLNAKAGSPEGAFFTGSPAWNVGIFNVGFNSGVSDYDILDAIVGKSLGSFGRIHLGAYYGATDTLEITASNGDGDRGGFMIGYDKGFLPVKSADGEFNRFVLAADYATGKNAIGGGGVGVYVFFTKDISLLVGPVWFNDKDLNGGVKFTAQLDVNFKF